MSNWPRVDAFCLGLGLDPFELPPQRFYNLCFSLVWDDPTLVFDDERRKAWAEVFEWADDDGLDGSRAERASDRRVRAATAVAGFNVDEQFAAMMDARRRAEEELARAREREAREREGSEPTGGGET